MTIFTIPENTIIVINFKNEVTKDMGYWLSWLRCIIKGLFWSSTLVSIVATISTVFGIPRDLGSTENEKAPNAPRGFILRLTKMDSTKKPFNCGKGKKGDFKNKKNNNNLINF